ncbi:hypothetical protein PRO82_000507 [Candidatus Protochlamydia amoebophila]|nr:hypothetical protein [Candidatus Protochlamydia amoebophila]
MSVPWKLQRYTNLVNQIQKHGKKEFDILFDQDLVKELPKPLSFHLRNNMVISSFSNSP